MSSSPPRKRRRNVLGGPTPRGALNAIGARRGLPPEMLLFLDQLPPDPDAAEIRALLVRHGVDDATAGAIAEEYENRPTEKQTLVAILLSQGVPKDVIDRALLFVSPPSDEVELAAQLLRAGLPRDVVESVLKEHRVGKVPVMLTVVAREEAEVGPVDAPDDWTLSEEELESGLSSERFWISTSTTVKMAIEEAIRAADAHYFDHTFSRDDDSTEVWATWADEWKARGSDYATGLELTRPFGFGVSPDDLLVDAMIKNLERVPATEGEGEGEGCYVTLL